MNTLEELFTAAGFLGMVVFILYILPACLAH